MSDKEEGFDIAVGLLKNSRIGICMALKVINLIVSGIDGTLSFLRVLLVSRDRK